MSTRRGLPPLRTLALAAGFLALSAGCRNPFLPSADVSIYDIYCPDASFAFPPNEIPLYADDVVPPGSNYYKYRVRVTFLVRNKVGVRISSVNMAFTNVSGEQVTTYAASGGKTNSPTSWGNPRGRSCARFCRSICRDSRFNTHTS